MNKHDKEIPDEIESPEEIIDDIDSAMEEAQNIYSDRAAMMGEQREIVQGTRHFWETLGEEGVEGTWVSSAYASGVKVLSASRYEMLGHLNNLKGSNEESERIAHLASGTAIISAATSSAVGSINQYVIPENVTVLEHDRFEEIHTKLSKIDEELASLYSSVREVLYGTRSNPERGALYLMRQLFDHLFGKLSPDDEVRKSPYWIKKIGEDNPNLVTRKERVLFAANTHISNSDKRETLSTQAQHVVDVYKTLNMAHKREKLDHDEAKDVLREMFAIVGDWVDALDQI